MAASIPIFPGFFFAVTLEAFFFFFFYPQLVYQSVCLDPMIPSQEYYPLPFLEYSTTTSQLDVCRERVAMPRPLSQLSFTCGLIASPDHSQSLPETMYILLSAFPHLLRTR